MVVGGPGTRTVACLGAAQIDRHGNLNSTTIPGGPFLVGSGGANDVASRATACVVVSLARPERLVERVGYVTSPGRRVNRIVTDRGVLRRDGDVLRIAAVPSGDGSLSERVRALADVCGWDVETARQVEELDPVTHDEVMALRRYDPERLFLS
jgi:acyl CoA:acetate/3-ketoacid CoA transferase beta subunit